MPRPCSIFVCLVVEHEDAGKVIPWRISIRSPESVELMGLDAQMPLPADLMPGDLNFKWEIRSLRFTEAGPHLIEISIDGESEWSLALEVQKRASNG